MMTKRCHWPLLAILLLSLGGCNGASDIRAGMTAEHAGNNDAAIVDFSRAIAVAPVKDKPASAAEYFLRGLAYYRKGEYDQAIADETAAIGLYPKFPDALNNRGMAYLAKDETDLAIADLNAAIKLRPDDVVAYNNRGTAYLAKAALDPHALDQAMADFDQALGRKADDWRAYEGRGRAYLLKGDLTSAVADESEAIRLNPKFAAAYGYRAIAYNVEFDSVKAYADASRAIELQPKASENYLIRGVIELEARRSHAAARDFAESTTLNPADVEAIIWLHIANLKSGVNDAAELDQLVTKTDQTKWPSQILAVFRHRYDPNRLLEVVAQGYVTPVRRAHCQADFFVGEYFVSDQQRMSGDLLIANAARICAPTSAERTVAQSELKTLR